MAASEPIHCNTSYIPTSEQYLEALGSFGSSVVIIGGLVTLGLFILFFEQVVYTNQTAKHGYKRHIYWIASVFPIMTLMSLGALLIPRAHNVCTSVKMIYMSIGISHFTDLTMVMFGGEELLVERAREDAFNLRLSPLCCCCKCLPRPPVTKYSLRLVVLLTDQLPFVQAFYYVMVLILLSADNITLGDVQQEALSLGLGFDTGLPRSGVTSFLEKNFRYNDSDVEKGFKQDVVLCCWASRISNPLIPRRYIRALQELRQCRDLVITSADKGGGVVVLDRTDYVNKMNDLLSDQEVYTRAGPVASAEEARAFNSTARRVLTSTERGKKLVYLLEENPRCPRAKGLPKTHKEGVPLRPIISGIGSARIGWPRCWPSHYQGHWALSVGRISATPRTY